MKLIGSLLVAIFLILGTYAAASAYVIRVDAIDPDRHTVTLHAPAGRDPDDPTKPVLEPGPRDEPLVLREEHLATLRDADTPRVHVKEFSWFRWREWYLFVISCIGLLIGSVMVRTAIKREMVQPSIAKTADERAPEELLRDADERVRRLREDLAGITDERARLQRILRDLDDVKENLLDPFVEARSKLISRLGMAGYAQLMDRFAAAERQVNRAWSSAADGVYEESELCLDQAILIFEETRQRYKHLTSGAQSST